MGQLILLSGNIVDDDILKLGDAVVLPTNPMMRCGAGVSGAIFKKAGVDALEDYTARKYGISYYDTTRQNKMKPTEVRITPGFALPATSFLPRAPKPMNISAFRMHLRCYLKPT